MVVLVHLYIHRKLYPPISFTLFQVILILLRLKRACIRKGSKFRNHYGNMTGERAVASKSRLCSHADLLTFQLICRKEKLSFSWYFDYSRTELNASLSGIPQLIPQDRAECDDVGRVGWTPTWKVESWKHRPGNSLNFPFPTNLVDMEASSQPEYSLFNLAWYVLVAWKSVY